MLRVRMQGVSPTVVADGIWSIHHRGFRVGPLAIGTRTNALRLADGTLALHSPGPIGDAEAASIAELGDVSVVVAPNLMHHLFLPDVVRRYPQARVVAVPGIRARHPALRIDEELGRDLPAVFAGIAEMMVLDGAPKLDEHVLFFPAARTLVAVDLAFNLHGLSGFPRLAMWLNGANDRFTVTRLARARFIEDRAAAGRSVRRMLDAWDVGKIVVAHGDVLEVGGRSALAAAWKFALSPG